MERRFRADSTATDCIISSAAAERHAARTAGNGVWSAPRGGPGRLHSRRRAQQVILREGTVRLSQRPGAHEVRPKDATVASVVCLHPLWTPACDSRSTSAAVSSRRQAASCGSPHTCRSAQEDCGMRPAERSSSRVAAVWCGTPGTPDRAWLRASPASWRGGMCRTCLPRVPDAACAGMRRFPAQRRSTRSHPVQRAAVHLDPAPRPRQPGEQSSRRRSCNLERRKSRQFFPPE